MKLANEKINLSVELKEDFTQAEFEKYQTSLIENTEKAKASAVLSRALLQAAIDAGILKGLTQPVADMKPRAVKWLTIKVNEFIEQQTEVPQD